MLCNRSSMMFYLSANYVKSAQNLHTLWEFSYETNSAQHGNVDFSAMLYVGVSCYSSQQYYVCCLKVFRDRILHWIPPKQQQIYFLRSDRELGHIFCLSKINSIQPRKPRGGFSLAGFPLNTYYLLLLLLVAHQICTAKKKKCLRYAVTL